MSDTEKKQFEALDWVLFSLMLAVSAGIGIFYAFKDLFSQKSEDTAEFLMGGRNMKLLPVAVSILVSFMSAILILGTPAEMYTAGTLYFVYLIGMILAIILASLLFVPLLYPLKLTSSFEYLELRFQSRYAKLTGTFIMVVQQILYMGIASFAPSTALEAVTGFPTWATIITVGCVSTFYTFLGGMKAVVWTDVFQSIVMIAGLLAIVIKGTMEVGGLDIVWEKNEEWDRIEFWEYVPFLTFTVGFQTINFLKQLLPIWKELANKHGHLNARRADPDPTVRHSVWSLVVGGAVGWLSTYGVNQASVQRYCAVPTLKDSKRAVLLNIIGVIILMTITSLAGIVMFAYYAQVGCDPYTDEQVENSNQLIPLFVMDVLGIPGLPGLFISCLFSGALSTMSSCLNALSAVTWEDVLKPMIGDKTSERTKIWITKLLVAVYGGAGIGFAFMAKNLGGTVLQASLSFTGAASGPLLGIFLLGGLFPWANWIGCVVGGFLGLALPLWISVGAYNLPSSGYTLDFPTDNCTSDVNIAMTTMASLTTNMNSTEFLNFTMQSNGSMTTTTMANANNEISGLDRLYTVSYLWYPSIGAATAVIVGLLVSFITGPMSIHETDPKYLIPFFDRLFCCLPHRLRKKLQCGYDFQKPEDIVRDEKDIEIFVKQDGETMEKKQNGFAVPPPFQNGIAMVAYRPKKETNFVYDNPTHFIDDRNCEDKNNSI